MKVIGAIEKGGISVQIIDEGNPLGLCSFDAHKEDGPRGLELAVDCAILQNRRGPKWWMDNKPGTVRL